MSMPDSELDKNLRALFGALDTRADFDVRLMARLQAESQADTLARARRARQQERARYQSARSMLRLVTLDTVGIALLLVVAVVAVWPRVRPGALDLVRLYGPYLAILLSLLIAAVPLLGMWADQTRMQRRP
jgi:uncharacterized membrane protein